MLHISSDDHIITDGILLTAFCLQESKQLLAEEERLIEMTDEVDYDVEG